MRLYPEKLAAHLEQQCLPVYLITGDEPLLVQECSDLVRSAARTAGCTDREILEVDNGKTFDWQALVNCASDLSLFGDRKLVELRLPSGKPGAEGSRAITEFLERERGDDVLLVISGKIDKQSQNSKWFKALDRAGAWVQLWPVKPEDLPHWLRRRLSALGLEIDGEALHLLADRVQGNLLAAAQEVAKLKLLAPGGQVDAQTVTGAVQDNARFNLFTMTDTALSGDAAGSLRMLHGLRGEGTEPSVALWALAREIHLLYELQTDCDQGQALPRAMQARRVWKSRTALLQGALRRHSLASLGELLLLATAVDGSIKGYGNGRPWDHLDRLVTALAA